jgi:hypothetical protein
VTASSVPQQPSRWAVTVIIEYVSILLIDDEERFPDTTTAMSVV